MEPIPPPGPPAAQPAKKKSSGCLGCFLGCLIALVVLLLVAGGAGFYVYSSTKKRLEAYPAEFTAKGFVEEKNEQGIEKGTGDTLEGKVLLNSPTVVMNGKADSDLAIIAIAAKIDGIVMGDLYYRGLALEIGPNAVVLGNIDAESWATVIEGYVKGEIKGDPGMLDESKRKSSSPAGLELPTEPEAIPDNGMEAEETAPTESPAAEVPEEAPPVEPPPAPEPPAETPPASPPAPDAPPPAEPPPGDVLPGTPPPDQATPQPAEPNPPDPKPVEPAPTPTPPPPPS